MHVNNLSVGIGDETIGEKEYQEDGTKQEGESKQEEEKKGIYAAINQL